MKILEVILNILMAAVIITIPFMILAVLIIKVLIVSPINQCLPRKQGSMRDKKRLNEINLLHHVDN